MSADIHARHTFYWTWRMHKIFGFGCLLHLDRDDCGTPPCSARTYVGKPAHRSRRINSSHCNPEGFTAHSVANTHACSAQRGECPRLVCTNMLLHHTRSRRSNEQVYKHAGLATTATSTARQNMQNHCEQCPNVSMPSKTANGCQYVTNQPPVHGDCTTLMAPAVRAAMLKTNRQQLGPLSHGRQ